jgi:uracil-DNA glycosylase
MPTDAWASLNARIERCHRCPRLRRHCTAVAATRKKQFAAWDYWGRPVPNFGDVGARLLIVGLAPAAHGANRTGRMFTGDRSGEFLYRALHETGFANQTHSLHRQDGLELQDAVITAAAHCAPPDNKPAPRELEACFEHLIHTARMLRDVRVCVGLGAIAFQTLIRLYRRMGWDAMKPPPRFAHGMVHRVADGPALIGSYHPSQQNTFTGRLTAAMLHDIFAAARRMIHEERSAAGPT